MPFYSLSSSGGLVEAATFAALPATGATGTLYVVTGTNTLYRWSGSAYVEVSASPAEVVEAANLSAFPATGAAGKIYVAIDTGKAYRWGGSTYTEISAGDWSTISNKPSTFAPSAHGHAASEITGLAAVATTGAYADVSGKPSTFSPSAHAATHASGGSDAVTLAVSQVTGLQTALDGKAATTHASSHASGGSDPISIAGSQVTTGTIAAARLPASVLQVDVNGYVSSHAALVFEGVGGNVMTMTSEGLIFPDDSIQTTAFTGAASEIISGTIATARLATGTASASTYLRGDRTWATISTYTLPAATTTTLGGVIVGAGLGVSSGTVSVSYGTTSGTACQGNDSRLSDARTPTDGSVTDAKIASAGLSTASLNWAAIQPWAASTAYAKGDLVSHLGVAYRRSVAGTSGATFVTANWQQITPSEFVASQITSGTLADARLSNNARASIESFIHPFVLGGL